ncbi:MAG: hypothetical protein A2156_13415 [Deltaproteobacteria bacterium RBG_16_48_10]|nr:MAG: hypothetical protein A2156_13415 [Deltaproteobacteria bacterium RBG_16_48_10]
MKLIHTAIVFDRANLGRSEGWAMTFRRYSGVIRRMVNPPGASTFRIRPKTKKLDSRGRWTGQWHRNGVSPIKDKFFAAMAHEDWKAEHPLSLDSYFQTCGTLQPLLTYPDLTPFPEKLHSSIGDFDFAYETDSGFRAVVEWETGNISSSHRSLNKMCLALMANLTDAGVLIVPSRALYPHLTDRIGNWQELCPYLAFWQAVGNRIIDRGLLAISVVEHDELVSDGSVPYIRHGIDGRSAEGQAKANGSS